MVQENSKLHICCFSDSHGQLPEIPSCDILLIAGDIVPLNIQRNTPMSVRWWFSEFLPWAEKQECKKIIVVFGNHDFFAEALYRFPGPGLGENAKEFSHEQRLEALKEALRVEGTKVEILLDSSTEFMGKTFYGTPWCPVLYNWAFYKSPDDLTDLFSKIPDQVDFLISHSPGKGCNKTGVSQELPGQPDYGCPQLGKAVVSRTGIRWWICGHIHSGNHYITELENGTKVVNVSLLGEDYTRKYPVLDLFVM